MEEEEGAAAFGSQVGVRAAPGLCIASRRPLPLLSSSLSLLSSTLSSLFRSFFSLPLFLLPFSCLALLLLSSPPCPAGNLT